MTELRVTNRTYWLSDPGQRQHDGGTALIGKYRIAPFVTEKPRCRLNTPRMHCHTRL
jgi:hypothetical protein